MSRLASKKPVQEGLRIVESLLDTRANAKRGEKLANPSMATAWMADQDLLPLDVELSQAEFERLVQLRESLRVLLLPPRNQWNEEAARRLNQATQGTPLEISFTVDRTIRISSSPRTFDGAFGKIVSLVVNGYFADQWPRFKTCANDECRKVFFDESRSGTRRWCQRRCGEVIRTRNHRRTERYRRG